MKEDFLHYETSVDSILLDLEKRNHYAKILRDEHVLIIKNAYSASLCKSIIDYLSGIGRNSLPNYNPIVEGAPNGHRINRSDPRSYVKGCFHQFSFYPWNQDLFDFFKVFEKVYHLKNILNGIPENSYVGTVPERSCVSRLSFQFYPQGSGYLNKHKDPVDFHQLVLPLLILSEKGKDFQTGGAYVEIKGKTIMLDDLCESGDIVIFNASFPHGVETIDQDKTEFWPDFKGRWMLLFAVNKLSYNSEIANAIDLSR
jgi:hypothetical protein